MPAGGQIGVGEPPKGPHGPSSEDRLKLKSCPWREVFYTVEPALGYSMAALLDRQLQILLLGSPSPGTPEFVTYVGQVLTYAQEGVR